jgi:hypothetical protein
MGACNGGYAGYGAYGGCGGGCGAAADNCGCERQRLCDRLKGMFKHRGNECGCETAAPVHVHAHASSCGCAAPAPVSNDCGCERQRLCDRLKGMFHRRGHGDCGCEGGAVGGSGCGCAGGAWGGSGYGGGVIGAPATGAPAEAIPAQPKPGEAPKKMPSTPMTMNGVIHDVTPVATPRLGIEQEGPRQPF